MLLKSIALRNLLSFKETTLELQALNVLIGPNASGKSNFIDAIGLLQGAATDNGLGLAIVRGGGVHEWINRSGVGQPASMTCFWQEESHPPISYQLVFAEQSQALVILEEAIKTEIEPPEVHFARVSGRVFITEDANGLRDHKDVAISPSEPVLSQVRSLVNVTPTTRIGEWLRTIRIYKEFNTGLTAATRTGVSATSARGPLRNGGDNLAMVLHDMDFRGTLPQVDKALQRFCDLFVRVKPRIVEGIAQTYVFEKGSDDPISAIGLSDGTLKFLCLLAILLDPNPAPLTCIEEPEVGLHPDALQIVADALEDASERTQLIVTTHSEALVDALSDRPEAVVVCERDFDNSTQFERLSKDRLKEWLEDYRLGELWRSGELGGNRW
jgi:predicted ATPase